MADQLVQLEQPISDAVPHIFKRPLLHVEPSDSLVTVATFLALGPQIYVDGLVVLDSHGAVGVIGGRHTIEYILYHQKDWLQGTASRIMSNSVSVLDAGRPLNDAFDIFTKTGFAFIPITIKEKVVTTLSVRDLLRLAIESKLTTPISQLSSPIISVKNNTSIGTALELMLEQGVRCLIVRDNGRNSVLNDRKILEYLLSYRGRQILSSKGVDGLFETDVIVLEPAEATQADLSTPASVAAERLLDVNTPCLLLGNDSIITPWDLVMKGVGKQSA